MAEAELDYGVFVLTLEGIDEATRRDCASRYSLDRLLAHLREFSSPGCKRSKTGDRSSPYVYKPVHQGYLIRR
jgi:hypothetical protein